MTRVHKWMARLDALGNRERVLVCGAGLAVLYLVIGMIALGPVDARLATLRRDNAGQRDANASLSAQRAAIGAQLAQHPDEPLRARSAEIAADIGRADQRIASVSAGLVPPARMTAVVRDLLEASAGLRLEALRTLPAAPLVERDSAAPDAGPYKHGIEVSVAGTYPSLVAFASRLEALPVHVVWNRTHIDAKAYPRVVMTLTLYTLSLERTWLTL